MFNIAPYISKYVRALHANDEGVKLPYSHTQFGVVLMVDIVGFSSLTTMAQEKGDSGAEAIAMEIGAYMGECIQVIEFYGGDVVKFLGDAVLVCFQNIQRPKKQTSDNSTSMPREDNEMTQRQKNVLIRKAVECGLQLLARLSHYRVYLTAEERSKHRAATSEDNEGSTGPSLFDCMSPMEDRNSDEQSESVSDTLITNPDITPSANEDESHYFVNDWLNILMPKKRRKQKKHNCDRRLSASTAEGSINQHNTKNSIDLELHMALSCGDVVNIVLGDTEAKEPYTSNYESPYTLNNRSISYAGEQPAEDEPIECCGRLEYAIGGEVVESLDEALSIAKAGEMCVTPAVYEIIRSQGLSLTFENRRQFYVISNIVDSASAPRNVIFTYAQPYKHTSGPIHRKNNPTSNKNNLEYLNALPGIRMQGSKLNIEPLVPRVRNASYMNIPANRNAFYYKYLNQSALYRMRNSIGGNIPAQFRDATIMFISLGKANVTTKKGLEKTEEAVTIIIKALVKYEGMLQQFAIDDKGATVLSVFGLPPLSHEREAVFAAKAALEIRESLLRCEYEDFAISLSTGTIFTAVLPRECPYRRDAGIAGDTIVIAVRMLKFLFSKQSVVCDQATKKQIGGLCEFEDLGENLVKGKTKPFQMYRIQEFTPPERDKRISLLSIEKPNGFIGYKSELAKSTAFIDSWYEAPDHHVLVISGPSGTGKSFLCNKLHKMMTSHGVLSCWSSSTEVEKGSKYYLLRNLIMALLDIIISDRIPQRSTLKYESNSNYSSSNNSFTSPMNSYRQVNSEGSTDSSPSRVSSNFIRNHGFFRRLNSRASVPTSSCVSHPNYAESNNEIVELIRHCLEKCGEEEGYIPLFKAVLPGLNDIEENRYTRLLDGRARDILLTGVITRITHYVSKHIGLVFICDDVQWADTASLTILQNIHEHCQRVMLLMATRPLRDYNLTFLDVYKLVGSYEEIQLNGLSKDEIGEIILQSFDAGVSKVSPIIINVVQKRTGGNPLYVKNMAIILKDFNHVTVVQGELVPSGNSFDLEDLLGNFDYKRIIKMQFDRLDPSFQEFLTVASCLDQFFTVHEVGAVIKPTNFIFTNRNSEIIQQQIAAFDVYHFLKEVDNGNAQENTILSYMFTHITIPQSIYDMVSYETRISLHRSLAKYYESQLSRENYPEILPKITRHYLQTDAIGKQLYYLEGLAEQNMQNYLLPEATNNLQKIVKILEENKLTDQFGDMHLSDVYRRLGICYTMRTKLPEGERFLHKALDILGEPWPSSQPQFLYKFWLNRFVQYYHRHLFFRHRSTSSQKERMRRLVEIMENLYNIYYYTGNGKGCMYACLVGLNACEDIGDSGPNYSLFLARNALLFWLSDRKQHSIFYISKALKLMNTAKLNTDTLSICAFLCFAAGKFSNARDLLYQVIEDARTLGIVTDCQTFYVSVGLIVTMRIFEGTFDKSSVDMSMLKQMADTVHANGDFEAEIWLSVYNVSNALVMDRMADCAPYVALLEAYTQNAASYNRIAIHGTLLCYYARNHVYDLAKRHVQKLINVLPSLTITCKPENIT
ncbi:hypothetical protein RMATCC62417_00573 [Rhizopus microsporus]|nr:hypothetical protein RMATCC62417_00573 [Rhizopus microsporus]